MKTSNCSSCPAKVSQTLSLPVNRFGNSWSPSWIICSTDLYDRGHLWRQTRATSRSWWCRYVYRSIVHFHIDCYFSWKTLCHQSVSSSSLRLSSHSYAIAIATPWILSLAVTSVPVLQHYSIVTRHQFLTVVIISLSTPLLITCTSYCVIWRKSSSRMQNGVRAKREGRLSKTLFLITGTFVLTWLPFQVAVVVASMCVSYRKMHTVVVFVLKLLQYSNSFINFLIYCLRMPDYRKTISQIFCICKCRGRTN